MKTKGGSLKEVRRAGVNANRPNSQPMDEHRSIKWAKGDLDDVAEEARRLGMSSAEFIREANRAIVMMIRTPGEAWDKGVAVPEFVLRARLLREKMPNILASGGIEVKRRGR